jgi:hypothetical protein
MIQPEKVAMVAAIRQARILEDPGLAGGVRFSDLPSRDDSYLEIALDSLSDPRRFPLVNSGVRDARADRAHAERQAGAWPRR